MKAPRAQVMQKIKARSLPDLVDRPQRFNLAH
ncbi:hypothetical protein [Mesorhizobium sp.]